MKDLLDELVDIAASLENVAPERVVITYTTRPRIEVLDNDGHPLATRSLGFRRVWSPPGGGFVRILSLQGAIADALLVSSKRRVDERKSVVSQARRALEQAESRLEEAEVTHARLGAIVDESVAAAVIPGARPDKPAG